MSKLLRRAKARFESAKMEYSRISQDDAYLDMCCFDLQQVMEFTLKYIVEMSGRKCSEKHSLLLQLADLDELGVEIPDRAFYLDNVRTFNTWETEARYFDDFITMMSLVEEVIEKIPTLFDFADSLVPKEISSFQNTREVDVFDKLIELIREGAIGQ